MNSRRTSSCRGLSQRLAVEGLRLTPQRRHVYGVLLHKRDHPTAEEVFIRARRGMPEISMATVYNCLEALVKCDLVRAVNLDRGATRYCPNMQEHGHFYCDGCGLVHDVVWTGLPTKESFSLPAGFEVAHFEISIRGRCPACSLSQTAAHADSIYERTH